MGKFHVFDKSAVTGDFIEGSFETRQEAEEFLASHGRQWISPPDTGVQGEREISLVKALSSNGIPARNKKAGGVSSDDAIQWDLIVNGVPQRFHYHLPSRSVIDSNWCDADSDILEFINSL